MSKLVAEAGEGRAHGYEVYGIIRDLIVEGKDAKFVDKSGRYVLNWVRALDCYADYRVKKNPDFNSTDQSRRKASNSLRTALLSNSYKKDGAKEYRESRKRNEEDEIVERQFQMPRKVFESLFGNSELSDSSEEQDEQERERHLSEGAVEAQVPPESSSDAGFDETMNYLPCGPSEPADLTNFGNFFTCATLGDPANFETEGPGTYHPDCAFETEMFDQDSVESALNGICSEPEEIPALMEVVCQIYPASGPVKGGYPFVISYGEPLPGNVSSGMADFEGVKKVELKKLNPYTFTGHVPASNQPDDVGVKVTSQGGDCLGRTFFRYVDELQDMIRQLVQDPAKQSSLFADMSQACGFCGPDSDIAQGLDPPNLQFQGDLDSTIQAKQKQSVKILELLVYTAAQTGAKQFIEMIFSTSARRIVFDSYKDRARLPEDVARANGHCNLAQYLQDITMRLTKEVDDKPKAIDWLELLKAVQNQVSVSQDKESKEETTPAESDDNSSDYFADTETSSCGSFEHDDVFTSSSEGKDAAEKGLTDSHIEDAVSKERLFKDSPCSSIPDANHLEHSKPPDNRKQNGSSFLGDLDDDVNECRGTTSIILKKENHRQDLVPKEVYGTRQNQDMQSIVKISIGDEYVFSLPTLLPFKGIEFNPGTSLIVKKDEFFYTPPLIWPSVAEFDKLQCSYSPLPHPDSEKVSSRNKMNMIEWPIKPMRCWLNDNPNSEEFPSAEGEGCVVSSVVIDDVQDKGKVQVVFLSMEWGSSKRGLPTVNRLLAIEFAKNPMVEVTLYAVECNEGDVREARDYGIRIIKASERPGFEGLDRLCFPPCEGFHIDVVIGHGVKLGKQAQMLKVVYPNLLWVQFEHTLPEELALYKGYKRNVYQGQIKHLIEEQLSQMADLVVAIGPKITEMYRTYLRPYPEKEVHQLVPTPSIFREFADLKQVEEERANFRVLVFGRGDEEDFQVKGYDIAPKAIAELNDPKYCLYFVGAPQGDMEKVTERLVQQGIDKSQLKVRSFITKREDLASLLCQMDLALMPSRTEGFGLTALEALTAGLPILVGYNSGFAEALKLLDDSAFVSSFIVKSDDAKEWATAIRDVKAKARSQRLNEAQKLKECYENTFDWSDQCKKILGLRVAVSQDKESKEETTPAESDDNSSDYFADTETSSCGSFEHDDVFTSSSEGKDAAEKGLTGLEFLLKEGPVSDEDIKNIIDDIAGDPEDKRELLKILGLVEEGNNGIDEVEGLDEVDGATPSVRIPVRGTNTYVGLLAALHTTSFRQTDVVFKHPLDKPDAIPSSTLEGGLSACEAYGRALMNGTARDKRVKVVLIGPDGAAKTNFSRLLRGKCYYNGGRRTGGIQIDVSENPWKFSSRRSSENEDKHAKTTGRGYLYESGETAKGEPSESFDEIDGVARTPVQAENVTDLLNEEDSSDEIWPVFWELSGDGVDRALHPMYMTPDAVYVLAFDLSEDTFDKGVNQGESRLENIVKHIDMVHSLRHAQSGDNEVSAPVFLVGVHTDYSTKWSKKEVDHFFDRLSQNRLINEHVRGQFTVDTTRAGQPTGKENNQINRLRQKIVRAAKAMPHAKKEIPSHWLEIENMIEKKSRNGKKFMSRDDFVKEICRTVPESRDADEILKFLQNRDSIVLHDGLVVLDQQWLLGVIRQILNTEPGENECMKARSHRIRLQKEGVLSSEHVDNVCRSLDLSEIKEHLISVMETFNLISPVEQNRSTFLVHYMLGPVPEKKIFKEDDNHVFLPVYLTFKTQHVPEGLFSRLVSRLRKWVATKTSCEQERIYSNAARFILNDGNFLCLVCYKSVIKLQVWTRNKTKGVSSKCLEDVCRCLKRSLGDIQKTCCWLRSVSWDFSIRCSLCGGKVDPTSGLCLRHDKKGCEHEDCAHHLPLRNEQYYCPDAKGQENIIPEELYKEWRRALQANENNNKIQKRTCPIIDDVQDKGKVQVVFLSMEWGSSKGGLPTVNRLLAIEFAKNPMVEVTLYAVECNEGDVREARDYGIRIIKASERPGYEGLDRLGFRPCEGFHIDVVIGHGVKLGKQTQMLKEVYPNLLWVQFEHTLPEELALYKGYERNVYQGEIKHSNEEQLSQMADLVVAIGPKITEMYRTYLRPYPEKEVHQLVPTPSIFREFADVKQVEQERANFSVLVFGRGDEEDFQVKGYDIAPKAIAELNDPKYRLYFVGAPQGDMEKVTERLVQQGIDKSQLKVRSFITKREDLASLLCQMDLALMPSRTEGFGLTALEALTAGLPILVGYNSGFAEALKLLDDSTFVSSFIVKSDDAKEWATAIRDVKAKERSQRLNEAQKLKECYENTFDWSDQCKKILGLILEKQNKVDNEIEAKPVEADVPDSAVAEISEEVPRKENLNPLYSQETPLPRQREVRKKQDKEKEKPVNHQRIEVIKAYAIRPTTWLLLFVFAVVFLSAAFAFTK